MAQYLKEEILDRIAEAALEVFAEEGFARATMAKIGRRAKVSTGNIYRYYANKDVLFDSLLPDSFADEFLGMIRRKVQALRGIDDYRRLSPSAPYHVFSEELLTFCIAQRRRVVLVLGHAEGTRFAGFADQLIDELVKLATAHFRSLRPTFRLTGPQRVCLRLIYENLVAALVRILESFDRETDIRQAVEAYAKYHLAGLKTFGD